MYAFIPLGVDVGYEVPYSDIRTLPPNTPSLTINGTVIATSLAILARKGRNDILAKCLWFPIDMSNEDPGETETQTRDVSFRVSSVSPIEVERVFVVRDKTPEELSADNREDADEARALNLKQVLDVLQYRSNQHAAWASAVDNMPSVTAGNAIQVLNQMLARQKQTDIWLSQFYDRFGDLIRYIGLNGD